MSERLRTVWIGDRWDRVLRLIARGYRKEYVAKLIGVTPEQIKTKLYNDGYRQRAGSASELKHDRMGELFEARDQRSAAADRRDLTASLCGDPPPGYSELDHRRGRA